MKTFNGSAIQRDPKLGIGKRVGNRIYVHWQYAGDVIPYDILMHTYRVLEDNNIPMSRYNCMRFDVKTNEVCVQEGIHFDDDAEPVVGRYVTIKPDSHDIKTGYSNAVWHHKWMWVKDDYLGFDVAESKQRSEYILSRIKETMIGGSRNAWQKQCRKWGI